MRWKAEHAWAAAALQLTGGPQCGPTPGPRVVAVAEVEADPGAAQVADIHRELLLLRKRRSDKSTCWVGTRTPRIVAARPESAAAPAGAFTLVAYEPVQADMHTQLLGMTCPASCTGLVLITPGYLSTAEVDAGGGTVLARIFSPAGPAFPHEDPSAEPILTAWASSRTHQAMLATRIQRDGDSWQPEGSPVDVATLAEAPGAVPLAFHPGMHATPPALLDWQMGVPAVPADEPGHVQLFTVGQLLGRLAVSLALHAAEGRALPGRTAGTARLRDMIDSSFGEELLTGGWEGVSADQAHNALLGRVLTLDEACFLPPAMTRDLLAWRTPRQATSWELLDRLDHRQDPVLRVRTQASRDMARQVFQAHPHWIEPDARRYLAGSL